MEAQLFNQQYQNYEDIPNVQDRLRWCRHRMELMQKEAADLIGITRGHYIDFDFNRFLYKGQGKMIREYRESLGLKKKQFARLIKLDPGTLRYWENDEKQVNKL